MSILPETNIIPVIVIQSNTKSINAKSGRCMPKYKKLHNAFNSKFVPNHSARVVRCFGLAFVHATHNDIAISTKRIFHTIGNTHPGGVILGLTDSYHEPSVFPFASNPPPSPIPNTISKQTTSVFHEYTFCFITRTNKRSLKVYRESCTRFNALSNHRACI